MHKFLVILAAFSFSAAAASAQTTPVKVAPGQPHHGKHADQTPEQRADHAAQRLTKELDLSAAQVQQVRQLHLSRAQAMQARKAQDRTVSSANKKRQHETMKAQKAQYDAQLKQILSADQYAKYAQLQADKKARHQARHQAKG